MAIDEPQFAAYVDAACAANGIMLANEERARVIAHFARIAALAATLLELPLASEVEMAPVFHP